MVQIINEEFSSDARRMQVNGALETLWLHSLMLDNDISDFITGLKKLIEHIIILAPQFERDYRSDAHKIDYPRRAVTEHTEWSKITIQSIQNHGY